MSTPAEVAVTAAVGLLFVVMVSLGVLRGLRQDGRRASVGSDAWWKFRYARWDKRMRILGPLTIGTLFVVALVLIVAVAVRIAHG